MYRAIPVGNKACAERVRQRNDELLKKRLKSVRSVVDNSVPAAAQLDHLRTNLKREQMLEDRYHEIDRQNRLLLQKMSDIMKQPGHGTEQRARSVPASLHRDSRKQELMRITQENSLILRRIQQTQPVYNHIEWEDAYKRSYNYLRNTCEFPPALVKRKPSRSSSCLAPLSKEAPASGSRVAPGSPPPGSQDDARFVLKEGKRIGERYYLVEMATDGRALSVYAHEVDQQRTLELLVSERNHRKLYRECGGDYSAMADRLRVDGDKLLLDVGGGTLLATAAASPAASAAKPPAA